jgi:aryl-alcohol dehydrogenase-like predicted oxidoreductase
VTPYDITADLHDSLARLQTDYIDLYLLHRDDLAVPVSVLVDTFNEHLQAGKIQAYGGSNWTAVRVREANAYAAANGLVGMTAVSPQFSLAVPTQPPWPGCISVSGAAGQAERDWYASQHIPLFTWSSVASGFFSGRFRPDNLESFDFWLDKVCVDAYCTPDNFARLERASKLAAERGLTPMQVAVAYVLNAGPHIFAIIGSRSPAEYQMNLTAVNCTLTADEIRWLESGR